MRLAQILLALLLAAPVLRAVPAAHAESVLERVRRTGVLHCAAPPDQPGFDMPEGRTGFAGFDVEICRAIAAAVLGDPGKLLFTPLPPGPRRAGLKDGSIDVLARDAPAGIERLADPDELRAGTSFYTGLGFIVRSATNIRSIESLDGGKLCLRRDPQVRRIVSLAMDARGFTVRITEFDSFAEAARAFMASRCDTLFAPVTDLAALRARADSPALYRIGDSLLTLDAYGPVVARGDAQWAAIVRVAVQGLVAAEGLNVSRANMADSLASKDRAVRRLLGIDADPGTPFGLPRDWVAKMVGGVGNYGEIFASTLGSGTPQGLHRWPNDQWFRGGLLAAPDLQ